jgi:hypothetical protein
MSADQNERQVGLLGERPGEQITAAEAGLIEGHLVNDETRLLQLVPDVGGRLAMGLGPGRARSRCKALDMGTEIFGQWVMRHLLLRMHRQKAEAPASL